MSFLFKKKKSCHELVEKLQDSIEVVMSPALDREHPKRAKAVDDISKTLLSMKYIIQGEPGGHEAKPEKIMHLMEELCSTDVLELLVEHMKEFEFEAKKDVASLFIGLLRQQSDGQYPLVNFLLNHPDIIQTVILGYDNSEVALNCGMILRECIKHESLSRLILFSEPFFHFFRFVEFTNFDVASDAMLTFKDLLMRHLHLTADMFDVNYTRVFSHFNHLLVSSNYVTRRQSLKLLGELLSERPNAQIMMRYISDEDNLKLLMNVLKDKSKAIQYEGFHVFKIFVANPHKPESIYRILYNNKTKIIKFLENFQNDRADEQFTHEKQYLMKTLTEMESLGHKAGSDSDDS
eukprot:GILJ01004505.1.p1 GENE.GILJ01004505.1~~GILJ01004505.1.p1  ORF type:complete len:376 (+),score=59.62 GILJ01004505.1:83-1129(+)